MNAEMHEEDLPEGPEPELPKALGGFYPEALIPIFRAVGGAISGVRGWFVARSALTMDVAVIANTAKTIHLNKLEHIFGNASHGLDDLVKASSGSQANAFNGIQKAANAALKNGSLKPGPNRILPGGQAWCSFEC